MSLTSDRITRHVDPHLVEGAAEKASELPARRRQEARAPSLAPHLRRSNSQAAEVAIPYLANPVYHDHALDWHTRSRL